VIEGHNFVLILYMDRSCLEIAARIALARGEREDRTDPPIQGVEVASSVMAVNPMTATVAERFPVIS
jgi:hypothetical protein